MEGQSAYAAVGAKLIERGYCAVPALPGTKVPGIFFGGQWHRMLDWSKRYLARLPSERDIEVWERAPNGGVCLIAGRASGGVVGVDIDVDEAVKAVQHVLPYTPARKRGQKGETLFYRAPPSLATRSFTRVFPDGRKQRLVDIIAEGRQTVLPPTVHPDTGAPYIWSGESSLVDLSPDELPELPADALDLIGDALRPLGWDSAADRPKIQGKMTDPLDKSPHRLLNEHALANLDAWVPHLNLCRLRRTPLGYEAVADWRNSNAGRPLNVRKLNLKMIPAGIVDFGDGPRNYTALDLVVACGRAPDIDSAFGLLADWTRWGSQLEINLTPRKTIVEKGVLADAETGEVIEAPAIVAAEPKAAVAPWKPAAVDATQCAGLVGEIADWIIATSDYQQPMLAIGAALTIVGTAAGRQLAGPTRSGTHLYTIGVAPTGAGKDHPLKSIGRILIGAKLSHLLGASKFTSESAIVNTVIRSPASACAMDEFGAFLARGKSRQASTHEQGISAMLRTLWSSSFDAVPTTERAGEQFKLLHSPGLSIYGTSTADELYDALGDADTRNGLLNRFLILENPKRPERVKPDAEVHDVPGSIIDGLKAVYYRLGELGSAPYHGQGVTECPPPIIVPWRDEFAELTFEELVADLQVRMDKEPDTDRFLVRTAEMALRIATIRAVGIDAKDPRVTQEDMAWGAAIALRSAQSMIEGARDNMAENERQRWSNQVLRVIKARRTATIRDIQMSMRGKMRSNELKDIIANLAEAGRIESVDMTDGRSDTKKRMGYRFLG